MTTTMGQLIAELYAAFDREYHDRELAAVATEVMLAELPSGRERARAPRERAVRRAA